jgi:hypothetical protein
MLVKGAVISGVLKAGVKAMLIAVIKTALSAFVIALVLFGFAAVGLLPQSPFRTVNQILMSETIQASAMLVYLPVFVPIFEMLMILHMWVIAIVVWYSIKVVLKKAGIRA